MMEIKKLIINGKEKYVIVKRPSILYTRNNIGGSYAKKKEAKS